LFFKGVHMNAVAIPSPRRSRLLAVVMTMAIAVVGSVALPERAEALTSRDFSVSVSPASVTLSAGQSAQVRVSVRRGSKFKSAVKFRFDNPLVGVTASPAAPATKSGLTVNLISSAAAPTQAGSIRVVVTGGGRTRSTTLNLLINGAPAVTTPPATTPPPATVAPIVGDFSMTLDPTLQFTITAGGSATVGVFVNATGGYSGAPKFDLVGLPTGVLANFVNPSSKFGTNLVLTASSTAARGIYPLTIRGIDGDKVRTVSTVMTVRVLGDFAITAVFDPTRAAPGSTANVKVQLGLAAGAVQIPDVDLTLNGLPPGATFTPATVRSNSTATFAITFPVGLAEGTYAINVRGESGSIIRSTSPAIVVSAKPLVSLTPASLSVAKGAVAQFEILNTPVAGIGQPAYTSTSTVAGSTLSIVTTLDNRRFLQVTTTASTPAGTYTIALNATSGSATTVVNVQLSVT
jgi:hypothetical protein